MNPRIYFVLSHFVEDLPDIDILSITYEDGKVFLRGAKENEGEWSWSHTDSPDSLYPLMPLLTLESFHYKLGKDDEEFSKFYNYKTKKPLVKLESVLPNGITLLHYDFGIEKRDFGEELSSLLRGTFFLV